MLSKTDSKNLIAAAQAGGKILRKYFGQALKTTRKSTTADFVTIADIESEMAIIKILEKNFPKYNIQSEENGVKNKKSDCTFIIDPMDGTNNYMLGIPNFTVSIGLYCKGEPLAAVVYQPILGETYFAERGRGAYLNGKRIKVNTVTDPAGMTMFCGCNYNVNRPYLAKLTGIVLVAPHKRVSWNWSVANDLCLLAAGKIECMLNDRTELHDYAAGKLIAQEAGAKIVNWNGRPEKDFKNDKFIASSTGEISTHVLSLIKKFNKND